MDNHLIESTDTLIKSDTKFLVNPSPLQVIGFYNRTQFKSIRFVYDPNRKLLLVWDADKFIHDYFIREYNRQYPDMKLSKTHNGFVSEPDKIYVDSECIWIDKEIFDIPKAFKPIKALIQHIQKQTKTKAVHTSSYGKSTLNYTLYTLKKIKNISSEDKEKLLLNEKWEESFDGKIKYLVNPSASEIIGLFNKSKYSCIRFAYVSYNKKLYVWDASDGIHLTFIENRLKEDGIKIEYDTLMDELYRSNKGSHVGLIMSPKGKDISGEQTSYFTKNFNTSRHWKKFAPLIKKIEEETNRTFKHERNYVANSEKWSFITEEIANVAGNVGSGDVEASTGVRTKKEYEMGMTMGQKKAEKSIFDLEEQIVRDGNFVYLINPSGQQIYNLYTRSKYKALRFLLDPSTDDLYVWDAADLIHMDFAKQILRMTMMEFFRTCSVKDQGLFSPNESHGNRRGDIYFGTELIKKKKTTIEKFIDVFNQREKMSIVGENAFSTIKNSRFYIEEIQSDTSKKTILNEKLVQAVSEDGVKYLENPTPQEVIRYMKKLKYPSVRGLYFPPDKKWYIWDAENWIHEHFIENELRYLHDNYTEIHGYAGNIRGFKTKRYPFCFNIDPEGHSEGFRIGKVCMRESFMKKLLQLVEKEYNVDLSNMKLYSSQYEIDRELLNEELLLEKYTKGIKYPHLINPTATEMYNFLMKTKYHSIRFIVDRDHTMYVWDADISLHVRFTQKELAHLSGDPVSRPFSQLDNFWKQCGMIEMDFEKLEQERIVDPDRIVPYEIRCGHWIVKSSKKNYKKYLDVLSMIEKKNEIQFNEPTRRENAIWHETAKSTRKSDFLNEAKKESIGRFTYLVNPTPDEVCGFIKKLGRNTSVRFLKSFNTNTYYFWNGHTGIHKTFVSDVLSKIEQNVNDNSWVGGEIDLYLNGDGNRFPSVCLQKDKVFFGKLFACIEKTLGYKATRFIEQRRYNLTYITFENMNLEEDSMAVGIGGPFKGKKYLENPTPNEVVRYYGKSKSGYPSLRGLMYNKTMYIWQANDGVHADFIWKELAPLHNIEPNAAREIEVNLKSRFNIDPLDNAEGTRIGVNIWKTHQKFFEQIFDKLAKKTNTKWTEIEPEYLLSGNFKRFGFKKTLKEEVNNDATFAGLPVFDVPDNIHAKFRPGKNRYHRWNKYLDMEEESCKKLYEYTKTNPKKSVIVRNPKGQMYYIRPDKQLYMKESVNDFIINPTSREIRNFINKTEYKSIRFIIDKDDNIYVWDSNDAIHSEFYHRHLVNNVGEHKFSWKNCGIIHKNRDRDFSRENTGESFSYIGSNILKKSKHAKMLEYLIKLYLENYTKMSDAYSTQYVPN